MSWNALLTFITLILIIAAIAKPIMEARTKWPFYRFLLWPGVVIHELSHAVVAKLLGARIYEINVFSKTGGHVTHGPTKIPFLGEWLVALAPIAGGLLFYYALAHFLLGIRPESAFGPVLREPWNMSEWLSIFSHIDWSSWKPYVFFFVFLNAGIAIAPSWQDIRNGKYMSTALLLVGILGAFYPTAKKICELDFIHTLNGVLSIAVIGLLLIWTFWLLGNMLGRKIGFIK